MTKYIFITGGVVSSLGKGIAAASIASILESRGILLTIIKLDPYLNIDPGTISPMQHGEVFVTEDGAETDLDLGHYERFTSINMTKLNNFTSGQVYDSVIRKERKGEYLGQTVQVVPHITNEIKNRIFLLDKKYEIVIVEIGGTAGDIEAEPFLESIRQIRSEVGREDSIFVHLTLVPYINSVKELKTKPTQRAVKEMLQHGIQPDILICRMDRILPQEEREKISLFCNIDVESVFCCYDIDSIYKIPSMLYHQNIDTIICQKLNITPKPINHCWHQTINKIDNFTNTIQIAVVTKYNAEAHKSINESLLHAGIFTGTKVDIHYINSDELESVDLSKFNGILVPGGFGKRGTDGMINAIKYARINNIPFFGICLGMQLAVVEYARNVCNLNANSTEFDEKSDFPIVAMINEWKDKNGVINHSNIDAGGTMRLGSQDCELAENSLIYNIYKTNVITERHRHRYEVNPTLISQVFNHEFIVSGTSLENRVLTESVELKNHKWFLGCQFHPEFKSRINQPHPLFVSFVQSTL